jgi:hypothetical protein
MRVRLKKERSARGPRYTLGEQASGLGLAGSASGLEDGLAAEVSDGLVQSLLAHLCAGDSGLEVAVLEVDAAVLAQQSGSPLCGAAFAQVAENRQGRS